MFFKERISTGTAECKNIAEIQRSNAGLAGVFAEAVGGQGLRMVLDKIYNGPT